MAKRQRQRQQLIFQQQEQEHKQEQNNINDSHSQENRHNKEDPKQEQQKEKKEFTIKINEGYCIKEHRLKSYSVYKIQHNIWYNRARRRFKKSQYFSDRA